MIPESTALAGEGAAGCAVGKPPVQWEQARLGAKAQQHYKGNGQHQALVTRHRFQVQHAANHKVKAGHIGAEHQNAQQRQGSAHHRVNQVLDARRHRVALHGMQHQREGQQGHGFIEHVEGDDGAGEAQRHEHPQGHQVKTVVPPQVFLLGHVLKGIRTGRSPDKGHDRAEPAARVIHPQEYRQTVRKGEERQCALTAKQYR